MLVGLFRHYSQGAQIREEHEGTLEDCHENYASVCAWR